MAAAQKNLEELQKNGGMLKEEVGEEDIAKLVSKWTGIPVGRLLEGEAQKLVTMESRLRQRVVRPGQGSGARREFHSTQSRGPLRSESADRLVYFPWPNRAWEETELARALAGKFLFDDERSIIRLDMSEYMEKHSVARMIGAPPGYVGYEEGGQLTEQVRRHPYSVVLFDEIEKAHPDVFNILLQILEDGRLTDGKGRTVDFRNTVLIMTSNVGSTALFELAGKDPERARKEAMEALRQAFRPEFINRIDDIVLFNPLGKEQLNKIVDLELAKVLRLLERNVRIELTPAARELVVSEGYDPAYGARPLRRTVQRLIQDPLAMSILNGTVLPGSVVRVDIDPNSDAMRFEQVEKKAEQEPPAKAEAAEHAVSSAKSGRRR